MEADNNRAAHRNGFWLMAAGMDKGAGGKESMKSQYEKEAILSKATGVATKIRSVYMTLPILQGESYEKNHEKIPIDLSGSCSCSWSDRHGIRRLAWIPER